ncbi:hypothetical protein BDDG_03670, partial [Blastomyces dermatitidis ATCC 18188]
SSHIDRSAFTDDSEPDVESLIENLEDAIMKELPVPCVARSPASSLTLSVSFSATPSHQSPTPASVSDSPAPTTSVPATSDFTVSAFIISSPHFKEMLHRLNKPHLSRIISLFNSIEIMNIHVFRNRNVNIVLFYTHKCETYTS